MVNGAVLMMRSDKARTTFDVMFEHHSKPLMPRRAFAVRMLGFVGVALGIVVVSLAIGTMGYMHFAGFRAIDAFLNASMILSGMGPVGALPDARAKIFASIYALYGGIAILGTVAVMLAPLVHRMLHVLHLEEPEEEGQ